MTNEVHPHAKMKNALDALTHGKTHLPSKEHHFYHQKHRFLNQNHHIPTNQQRLFLANPLLLPPKCRPTHNHKPQTTADPPTTASHKPPTCNINNPQTPLRTTHPNPPVGDTPSHPTHPSKLAQRTKSIEFRSYLQIPAIAKCIIEKRQPKLKSKYQDHVEKAIEYARTIESWEDLVDPRTLAFYCLGLDPSPYILHNINIEGKKKMMTRFNKDMYAKMRSKKDEPSTNIGKKGVCVTGKGPSVFPTTDATPIVSGVENVRIASPATSVEEIPTPSSKRQRVSGKEKEKERVGSCPPIVWDDEGMAMERTHGCEC
ncbi:uncharacterized protein LOC115959743 [Quercus lobata]|uniref:uncharacterized protein LOC115959743 n=1 Tax=Quercus lobata TaxID=97700 RepID=UPI001249231D|nr:uncharacterized protein LOC115959743 [Quercus lobata]